MGNNKKDCVMIVYAFHPNANCFDAPWIYGVYTDCDLGFCVMEEMQESEEYGHLIWSNQLIRLNKDMLK